MNRSQVCHISLPKVFGSRYWIGAVAILLSGLAPTSAWAVNSVAWEAGSSLIDTTNFNGLAQYYWFPNFNSSTPVTGAPLNQNEVRNLPSWIHMETRPACIGMDDSCVVPDSTIRTGFSFVESGAGSTSTGGQAGFNMLTLPNGATGLSGQAVDNADGTGTTAQAVFARIDAGAPSAIRLWVVTDNGAGQGYNQQIRMRVSLRGTNGPPDYTGDIDQVEAEAMPNGVRIGQTPVGINGIADAWAFRLSDLTVNDFFTIRPTSAGGIPGSLPGFSGIMIQVIPEPASAILLASAVMGLAAFRRRR